MFPIVLCFQFLFPSSVHRFVVTHISSFPWPSAFCARLRFPFSALLTCAKKNRKTNANFVGGDFTADPKAANYFAPLPPPLILYGFLCYLSSAFGLFVFIIYIPSPYVKGFPQIVAISHTIYSMHEGCPKSCLLSLFIQANLSFASRLHKQFVDLPYWFHLLTLLRPQCVILCLATQH